MESSFRYLNFLFFYFEGQMQLVKMADAVGRFTRLV